MKKYYILITLLLCQYSFAFTDCGPFKVVQIQTQATDLLVLLRAASNNVAYWKQIGPWSNPSTKPHLALLMQSYAMNKNILLRYSSDGYSCFNSDYNSIPTMIRIH